MVGFRVLVNLGHYFSDYRQKSWVYVDPNRLKTLTDLKKHICEIFAIDNDFEVFVCGCYIPSKEDVGIINEKDVLELRKPTGDADVTMRLGDVFSIPTSAEEGESKKRKKKRKNNTLDSHLHTPQSVDNIDLLSENFHPEYDYNTTAQKKQKKTLCSLPVEEFVDSSVDSSKKLGKKKSDLTQENCWNAKEVVYSSIVQIPNERIQNSMSVCTEVENEETSTVKSTSSTKNCLETSVVDFRNVNNSSDVKEVASDATRNVLSSFKSSLLEHPLLEGAGDVAERDGDIFEISFQKKRRNRRGKRKHKKVSCDNTPVSAQITDISKDAMFPRKQTSINTVSNSRKHMRFSDSGDDEEISVCPTTKINSIGTHGQNEICSSEANGAVRVDVALGEYSKSSSILGKTCMSEGASLGDDKTKKYDEDSHDQVSGQILTYDGVKDINIPKLPQSSSLPVGRRSRKAVLNSGLGATLAHLMQNCKRSETCVSDEIPSNQIDAIKIQPPPSVPNKPSSSSKNYTEFPIVEKLPREGDILAFKILKMNDHYEPCISSFIECVVTACDQNESVVTIRILEGVKEFDRINGKFEIQLEGEEKKTENQDVVLAMEWKDIIEPRLIFP